MGAGHPVRPRRRRTRATHGVAGDPTTARLGGCETSARPATPSTYCLHPQSACGRRPGSATPAPHYACPAPLLEACGRPGVRPSGGGGARGAGAWPRGAGARADPAHSGPASHAGVGCGRAAGPPRPALGHREAPSPPTRRAARSCAGRGCGDRRSPATATGSARATAAPPDANPGGHAPSKRPRRSRQAPWRGMGRRGTGPRPAPRAPRRCGAWHKGRAARRPHGSGRWGRRPPPRTGCPTATRAAPLGLPSRHRRATGLRPPRRVAPPSGAPATPARPARTGACFSGTQRSPGLGTGALPEAGRPGRAVRSDARSGLCPAQLPSPPPPRRGFGASAAVPVGP
jgi:hypothetical protein